MSNWKYFEDIEVMKNSVGVTYRKSYETYLNAGFMPTVELLEEIRQQMEKKGISKTRIRTTELWYEDALGPNYKKYLEENGATIEYDRSLMVVEIYQEDNDGLHSLFSNW